MDKRTMISIVDDDESVRDATANLMRAAGYTPQAFPHARAFLESSHVSDTDILIADVDVAANARSHARQLFLRHRRPELYADWIAAVAEPHRG